jgi:hypothetical protein
MFKCRFTYVAHALAVILAVAVSACSPTPAPLPTPDLAATTAAAEAQQAAEATADSENATRQAHAVATDVAATLTAQPTSTPTETYTPTPEPTATKTPAPTSTDTPAATATKTNTPKPTLPPVTLTPTSAPVPASIYSEVGGPAGFYTVIECTRGGAPCTPQMPTGDITFEFLLGSDTTAPGAVFLPYGLSVERDGANVADMFMFVDAGYLVPGRIVWFGSSRNFTVPGRYVIRSSGCMATSAVPCGWTTMAGTAVTFVIK